jgi:hypothetical protein
VKIWFQNRRTKFKRKYTSDVETLASHYYSSLGIGGIARPMVVGDRLWLFSQPMNGTGAPIQSILLNNVPPQSYAPVHMRSSLVPRTVTNSSNDSRPIPHSPLTSPRNLPLGRTSKYLPINEAACSSTYDFRLNNENFAAKSPEDNFHLKPNEIASLESRFGQNSSIFSESNKLMEINVIDDNDKSSSSSDVDCEEIEISEF